MNADLDNEIEHLEAVREHAVNAGLDYHFVSEVEHLLVTARHNREEAK